MADNPVTTYDPMAVNVNFGGLTMTGFASGTMVSVKRTTPERFKKTVGAKGEVSRTKVTDNSGTIEITLKHTSPCNRKMYQKIGDLIYPITVKESKGGKILAKATHSWIEKPPEESLGQEEGNCVWVIGCEILDITRN